MASGGMHGKGGACVVKGACVAREGVCGEGRACIAKRVCMVKVGCAVQRGACVAGETSTAADGTHPTVMHSCDL